MGQHQQSAGLVVSVLPFQIVVDRDSLCFCQFLFLPRKGLHAPLNQRAAGVGKGVGHVFPRHGVGNHGEVAPAHHGDIRHAVVNRGQALHGARTVHGNAAVESACAHSGGHLVVADADDGAGFAKSGAPGGIRRETACRGAGGHWAAHQGYVDPGGVKDLLTPGQSVNVKGHGPGGEGIVDLRVVGQMPDHKILNQVDPLCAGIHLRAVSLNPHDLADGVHLVGPQAGDVGNVVLAQLLHQPGAFLRAPGVGVEHGGVQGVPRLVHHDESLAEAGDANPCDIRVLRRHLLKDGIDAVHHGRKVNFVAADLPPHRIIPVGPPQLPAFLVKDGELTAGGSDIQSCQLHISRSPPSRNGGRW